ncbi:DUF819 family protein [Leptospira wolffii]|uniref:DUF819 family protein n=1 Tax=Leptospira wolffii TaxID=409998 RepID=UPI001083C45B|nr:DUF819 family protein [Leptospira wolffii]TGL54631.1 DUF819 family protein [Leptospira wolffii]
MSEPFSILISIVFASFLLGFPWVANRLSEKYKWAGFFGPVVICYAAGILLGNLIPEGWLPKNVAERVSELSIPIAIPLLLASSDFLKGIREAKVALFSFFLSCLAVVISSSVFGYLFASYHPESFKIEGMLTGLYTGGTPNLNAIGLALDAGRSTIALVNAVDLVVGGTYLLFLLSFAKKVYSIFLKPEEEIVPNLGEESASESGIRPISRFGIGLALAVVGFALSIGVSILVSGGISLPILLLGISSWGIGISFSKKVRNLNTYTFGSYFILIFSVAIGYLADLRSLVNDAPVVFVIVLSTMSGAILLHLLFGILFRIPVDTWIITSVSSIYGPVFVPPVAAAIRNQGVLILGILTGLVGYAVGNYLGLAVYWFLANR